jgi:hypothetical protein
MVKAQKIARLLIRAFRLQRSTTERAEVTISCSFHLAPFQGEIRCLDILQ